MTLRLAVLNQKGGVGKTMMTVNLAAALARQGRTVLVIDVDPQANSTDVLLGDLEPPFTVHDLYEADVEAGDADQAVIPACWPGVHLIASDEALAQRETEAMTEMRLRHALDGATDGYDVVLIDCPPSLGRITLSALIAADKVLLVADTGKSAIKGLGRAHNSVQQVARLYGKPDLDVVGVVVNRARPTLDSQARRDEIVQAWGAKVLAVIPERTSVAAAYSSKIPLHESPDEQARYVGDLLGALGQVLLPTPLPEQAL